MTKLMNLITDRNEFLNFLKAHFHLYHLSNVFFRDFQYGIIAYAEQQNVKVSYAGAEEMAYELARELTDSGVLKPVKPGSWMLIYEPFRKPSVKTEAAAKPGAPGSAATPATMPAA